MATELATRRRASGFLRLLEAALMEGVRTDVDLAMKVAVLTAAGYPWREISEQLELTPAEFHGALERLRRIKLQPERYAGAAYLPELA